MSQLSENFIFIYLGLSLFTDNNLQFKPLLIIVTVAGICVARWTAVFPLSRLINWFIRYRAKRMGKDVADELPYSYQAMLFWAGLRGAVGVALAAGLAGENAYSLKATVLVVVVLTVIIFGGTTARMLEILGIKTGVVEEIDSDDEFDIEAVSGHSYYKRAGGSGIGNHPRRNGSGVPLGSIGSDINGNGNGHSQRGFASGNASPGDRPSSLSRKGSRGQTRSDSELDLLGRSANTSDDDLDSDMSDLPPAARRSTLRGSEPDGDLGSNPYPTSGTTATYDPPHMSVSGAMNSLISGTTEDHAAWFRQLDEGFIKPKLLLDGGRRSPNEPNGGGPSDP
jgi:sodium/hydrogen exchanger-like protein 6/7